MARVSRRNLAIAAVALAAVVPYLRTIPDYFVQDDFGGMQLLAAKPWHTFPLWFTMPWMEFIWGYTPDEIRPFTALSYQITALPGASVPHGHHILNVLLHGANAILVLAIARRAALMSLAASTIAALAFALLPLGAESVAWITGRVDSLPAFYYLLSFLSYVMWRRDPRGANSWYIWSLVWLFQALLSKQNTITMVAAVAAYDWMVLRRPIRPTWAWIRPYVPFALMTAGFLGLRYLILGEVLRESQLSSQRFAEFGGILSRHLHRMVWWDLRGVDERVMWFGGIYAAAAVAALVRADAELRNRTLRAAAYFAIVWVALGLAPTVAAGYESPRHAYLAAAGWTILIGLGFDALRHMPVGRAPAAESRRASVWTRVVTTATVAILVLYGVRLHHEITDWRLRSAVSELATRELEREVRAAPPGTLFIVGAPVASWEWGAPFVAKPPYATTDLTARATIVMPRLLHCCRGGWWDKETRDGLARWSESGGQIVGLLISPSGEIRRLSDNDDPQLRVLVSNLRSVPTGDNLDRAILDILRKLVAGRGRVVHAGLNK